MKKLPKKISRVLFNNSGCIVKIHVNFYDNNNIFMHKEYDYNGALYLSLTPWTYITIERYDQIWNKSNTLLLNESHLQSVVNGMKTIIKNIYEKDIFAIKKSGEIIIYSDRAKENTVLVKLINSNMVLLLRPSVLVDENEITYEAVTMHINKIENDIQLSIETFESLYNILNKIDLFMYSQLLINYMVSYYNDDRIEDNSSRIYNKLDVNQPDSTLTTKYIKKNKFNIFEGLKPDT